MKRMHLALLVASTLCISSIRGQAASRYPFVMWSEKAFPEAKESATQIEKQTLINQLKSAVETSKPSNVIVALKEGLNSKELI